ncbi:MAG: glycoside hydrolase family 2, partial [Pseudopedobacter saltans]
MRSCLVIVCVLWLMGVRAQETQVQYLSGKGNDDMVQWDFLCTGGMNANKWTKIGVPSCWELQGFGKYNYGFAKDSLKGKEKGLYKYIFQVPKDWKNKKINIVFEGVMTDAEVKVNGIVAGSIHQGAFYAFKYDISKLIHIEKPNILEVTVAKHSADKSVNAAEREGDFWIFGGIFRPVWLEALPAINISQIQIDAKADGTFKALVHTNSKDKIELNIFDQGNKKIQQSSNFSQKNIDDSTCRISTQVTNPKLWSSEFPNLYRAEISIVKDGEVIHSVCKKFGFRTIELKQRDGIYVNGVKIKFKGINRHSFRPETGRTMSKQNSIEDVLLIKEMNMNAVRMSHYPPDDHFLDVCDSLGLYVMDELAGWHGMYNTPIGSKLLKEMIDHDENHPSIIFWSNGNEGGHNLALDPLFFFFYLQKRPVVHPWQLFNGIETQHYRQYNYGVGNYDNGREIVMPTEFLHGQFDGGHGAGLEDYWNKMWNDPLHAGGFLWDFADQAVVRKDLHDSLDTDKSRGADGIVGPHHEKEGSFFAVKEIWSPVYFEKKEITSEFDQTFTIENRYHFTNIKSCSFTWKLSKFELSGLENVFGTAIAPDIAPLQKGKLQLALPQNWLDYDILYVTAKDQYGLELFTWSFPISSPKKLADRLVNNSEENKVTLDSIENDYKVKVKDVTVWIDIRNGLLKKVVNSKGLVPLSNGPIVQ